MDHLQVRNFKESHPSLKLLNADNSPLIISFLYQQFKEKNLLTISKDYLESSLSNYLYYLRTQERIEAYPRTPAEYLEDWTNAEFLRSYYSSDDKIYFELTHYTEKSLDWIKSLIEARKFVGTESRLLKIISTLKELAYESTTDTADRLKELEKQKQEIEFEIEKVNDGLIDTLTGTQIRERYFETCQTINDMLRDFKEIEHNFRQLDMAIREKLIQTYVKKGEILDDIFSTKDHLRNTDQGKSLDAFWNLLLSQTQRDELDKLIEMTLDLQEIQEVKLQNDTLEYMKIRLIKAGEKVQHVNHSLAEQLSRFLDESAYLENKRIMNIINDIKSTALIIKNSHPPEKDFITIEDKPEIELIMDRPLWSPPSVTKLRKQEMKLGSSDEVDTSILYDQFNIDQKELKERIQEFLESDSQVSLRTITEKYPIKKGVAEILTYIDIASKNEKVVINEDVSEIMVISNMFSKKQFKIEIPQIIFCRSEV